MGAAPNWLSPKQVCELIPGMTIRRLEYLRGEGRGPRYAKPTPRTILYSEADVHSWVVAALQETRDSV